LSQRAPVVVHPDRVEFLALIVGAISDAPGKDKEGAQPFLQPQPADAGIGEAHGGHQRLAAGVAGRRTLHGEGAARRKERQHLIENAAAVGDQVGACLRLRGVKDQVKLLAAKMAGEQRRQFYIQTCVGAAFRGMYGGGMYGSVYGGVYGGAELGKESARKIFQRGVGFGWCSFLRFACHSRVL
jgi:hypothetical protein